MPKIEVDEEDFLRNEKLRKTVQAMMAKPSSAKLLKLAEKEIDPTVVHPELEVENMVNDRVGKVEKSVTDAIAELRADREKEKSERNLERIQVRSRPGSPASAPAKA